MDDDEVLLSAMLVIKKRRLQNKNFEKRKHKVWVRKIFSERKWKGEHHELVKEMKLHDHKFFYKQFCMSPTKFENLLTLVGPALKKSAPN